MQQPAFYNLNASRGYPLDDTASGLTDDGRTIPTGVIVDAQIRFPAAVGTYAFLSAVHVSSRHVSVIVSVNTNRTGQEALRPVGYVTPALPVLEGVPYRITPTQSGIAGWVVFGRLQDIDFNGRFSTPAQSGLLPRLARSYTPPPVSSVAKYLDTRLLEGVVNLQGEDDIEIVAEPRTIDGHVRNALVFRLGETDAAALSKYVGTCGGRPESYTCETPAVENFGDAIPDEDGNIELVYAGLEVTDLPHGQLLHADIDMQDVCAKPDIPLTGYNRCVESPPPPPDPDPPPEPDPDDPDPPVVTPVTYPYGLRFYAAGLPSDEDYLTGGSVTLVDDMPSLPLPITAAAPNPRVANIGSDDDELHVLNYIADYDFYLRTRNVKVECVLKFMGAGPAGLMIDLRPRTGRRYFTFRGNPTTKKLELGWFDGIRVNVLSSVASPMMEVGTWFKMTVTIRQNADRADWVNFMCICSQFEPGATTTQVLRLNQQANYSQDEGTFGIAAWGRMRYAYFLLDVQ